MPSLRWQRVRDALCAALEREPPAREAFLTGHCAGDPELLAEVHSLLEAHEGAGSFLGGQAPSDSGSLPGGAPRVRRLFQEAADLIMEERTPGIEAGPPHDGSLRREVAALLHVYERGVADSAGGVPAPGPDPFLGRTISHYKIFEKLGEGGMGVVYRARDTGLGRVVALKFPAPGLADDADARARVLREARAASALDHVNICTIHEIGETDAGQVFIAMACYAGETLDEKLQRSRLPLDEVLGYGIAMAQGLAKAHEHGIAHRDIKPANVMVTDDGVVKLLDFGLAALANERLTEPGVARATPAYMSPEQARGERVDHRSDIWSLGVVLYEMLTGCRPFRGSPQAVIHGILHDEPEAVTTRRPETPALLEQIVARALARRAADRYANAEALLRDLRQARDAIATVQSAAGAIADPASPRERLPGGQAMLDRVADRHPTHGWLRLRRRHLLRSIPVAALAGAAAVLVAFGIGRQQPPPAMPAFARTEIAVLPFQNLSAAGPHAYFAAGLHDELLAQLSKVGALTVISRTSAMAYEGTSTPLRRIAAELGVGSVLEGTVQVLDGRLRVNVQLIDAATDAHVWSSRYDRSLEDAFDVQSDIAQQIARAVGASLSRDEQLRLVEAPTPNTVAYHLYLQARAYLVAPTGDYWPRHVIAQQLLEQALALDAGFVLAHVELSLVHGRMYWGRFDPTPARAVRQLEAAETALQLAPHLPEAHFAMGLAHWWGMRDYEHALEWFARGLEGLPNDHRLLRSAGSIHRRLGNWDQAIAAMEHAARFDPLGLINPDGVGNTLAIQRRYGEAVFAYDRFLQRRPDAVVVRLWKATAYLHWEGRLDSLRAVVGDLPADQGLGGAGNRAAQHLRLLFLERQTDSLLYVLGTTEAKTFEMQFSLVPAPLYAAWAHRLRGDHLAARVEFESARALLDSAVLEAPDDPRVHAARGLALAGLGRHHEALREARWLEQSEIYQNDTYEGPMWAEQRARILAQLGEAEAALDEIEGLLSRPSWLSVHMLRLDPLLDPIRGHPRFQALLTRSTPLRAVANPPGIPLPITSRYEPGYLSLPQSHNFRLD
jgi:eukaryotic-like serine/threonine-protein kinase